jgi:hypothetical protein
VRFRELTGNAPPDAEDSATIRQRVIKARTANAPVSPTKASSQTPP